MKVKTRKLLSFCPTVCKLLFVGICYFFSTLLPAQSYLGVGLHLTPPIQLDYTQNTAVVARARPGLGGSITYKKEWAVRKGRKWYAEAGLTVQGFRYYQVNYTGDSTTIWSRFLK